MAMLQMKRIYIYALGKDRKPVLELLQRKGVVEIGDMLPEDKVFHKTDVSAAKSEFEKNVVSVKEAIQIIDKYAPEKKSMLSVLNGRKEVSPEEYEAFSGKYESTVQTLNKILALSKGIAENKAEIIKLETQAELLLPWTSLDIPMNFNSTKYTKSFIGTLPKAWAPEEIYEKLAFGMPLNVDIISSSKAQTCIFVLCMKEKADSVYEALRAMDFSTPGFSIDEPPAQQLEDIKHEMSELKAAITKAEAEIRACGEKRKELLFLQDYDTMRADKYEVISHLLQTKNVFVLTGFIPEREISALTEELNSRFELAIDIEKPRKKDDVPVLLDNNGFSKPLEGVLAGYSLPARGETDPTMIMSLFYYMLYGLMLSDAGYGALMAIACAFGLVKFKKTLEAPMKNTLKMYLFCGIATVFWGVMFGSYFGDIVDVVSEAFFGRKVSIPPLWFFPVNEPMRMLIFSMLIGLIHLLTGLLMKCYNLIKQKDYKGILYDVATWFFLIISLTILLLSLQMFRGIFGITFIIPQALIKASTIVAVVCSAGIILTNGRESKNPFKRFLKGLYAFYGITGYLSDVLSYSRLLALGLATGVIATVINKMAAMTAHMFLGPVFFIIIIIFGHSLNIGINALGAYVHTNRLQYVEFFGKFYEGGGRKFNPFGMNTKYYKVKEKM